MIYCVSDIHGELVPFPDPHRDPHGKIPCGNIRLHAAKEYFPHTEKRRKPLCLNG